MSNSGRLSTPKILCRLAVGFVLLSGAFAGWGAWSTARAWERIGSESERLITESIASPAVRVLLRAPSAEGNAWADYQKALQNIQEYERSEGYTALNEYLYRNDKNKASEVAALVAKRQVALEALAAGARRVGLSYDELEEALRFGDPPHAYALTGLVQVALCDVRLRSAAGDHEVALSRVIDILQFTRDWAESSSGNAMNLAYNGAIRLVAALDHEFMAGAWRADDLLELERVLTLLDQRPPDVEALHRRDLAFLGARLTGPGLEAAGQPRHWAAEADWRHFYSDRLMMVSFYGYYRAALEGSCGSSSWTGVKHEAYWKGCQPEPRLSYVFGFPGWMAQSWRAYLSCIRVLRAAARWARMGERLELDDPLGEKLSFESKDGVTKISSAGWKWAMGFGGRGLSVRVKR